MVNMGRDFHPPRRANLTQWRKIELLVQANLLFHSCGCSGPGARPRSLADATSQLRRRRSDRKAFAPAGRWRGPVALGVTVR
jgi:hypothetical protein